MQELAAVAGHRCPDRTNSIDVWLLFEISVHRGGPRWRWVSCRRAWCVVRSTASLIVFGFIFQPFGGSTTTIQRDAQVLSVVPDHSGRHLAVFAAVVVALPVHDTTGTEGRLGQRAEGGVKMSDTILHADGLLPRSTNPKPRTATLRALCVASTST